MRIVPSVTMLEGSAGNLGSTTNLALSHHEPIIKRIKNSISIYKDIISILKQRIKLEKKYGKDLQRLSDKWLKLITESQEYGSTRETLLGTALEGIKVGQTHCNLGTCDIPELIAKVERLMLNEKTFITDQEPTDLAKFTETQFRVNVEEWNDILKNEQNEFKKFTKVGDRYGKTSLESKEAWGVYKEAVEKRKKHLKVYEDCDHSLLKKCHNMELARKGCLIFLAMDLRKTLYPIESDEALNEYHDFMNILLTRADAEKDVNVWNRNNGYDHLLEEFNNNIDSEAGTACKDLMTEEDDSLINGHPLDRKADDEVITEETVQNGIESSSESDDENNTPWGRRVTGVKVKRVKSRDDEVVAEDIPESMLPVCPRCGVVVYHAEQKLAAGRAFHDKCFKCFVCKTLLDSLRVSERSGEIFCKSCYIRQFGPKGYGFGPGGGTLRME